MTFDAATMGLSFAGPGMDTRLWITNGFVKEESDGQPSVRFTSDDGTPFPEGPIVTVILQPSMVEVQCRVMSNVAGVQEGEWFPFLERDEVVVGIPSGNEMAGPIILGRMNNAIDTWPTEVAGMDATKNNLAFRRLRTPYAIETASAYLVRSALTGAQFGLDQDGQVIFNDSEGSRFFMGADVAGFSLASGDASVQLIADGDKVALTGGGTTNFVMDSGGGKFLTKGTLNLGTSGLSGVGHGVTVEQVVALIAGAFNGLYAAKGAPPVSGPIDYADITPAKVTAFIQLGIPLAAVSPITPYLATITAALQIPTDPTGTIPGIGRAGFLL